MRKIDVFTHISPPGYSEGVERIAGGLKDIGKRTRGVPMLHDLDVRFQVMEQFPGYQQVLSLPTPPIELYATPEQAIELARIANDSMAELVREVSRSLRRVRGRAADERTRGGAASKRSVP